MFLPSHTRTHMIQPHPHHRHTGSSYPTVFAVTMINIGRVSRALRGVDQGQRQGSYAAVEAMSTALAAHVRSISISNSGASAGITSSCVPAEATQDGCSALHSANMAPHVVTSIPDPCTAHWAHASDLAAGSPLDCAGFAASAVEGGVSGPISAAMTAIDGLHRVTGRNGVWEAWHPCPLEIAVTEHHAGLPNYSKAD